MKIKRIVFTGILLTILAAGLGYRPTAAQESTPSSFGVETKSFDEQVMGFAEDANTYWLRYNGLRWMDIQAAEGGPLDWSSVSQLETDLADASSRGMEVILIVRGTPAWAAKYKDFGIDWSCGPMRSEYIGDFASFMAQVVARYSVAPYNVKYYELFNEPDEHREWVLDQSGPDPINHVFGCWGDASDTYFGGRTYADMLKQVHPAMKAANPEVQIVLGGLLMPCGSACNSLEMTLPFSGTKYFYSKMSKFFEGILVNGGGPFFDIVNFHGYTIYNPIENPDPSPGYRTGILMERNEWWWASKGGQVIGKLTFLKEWMSTYGISDKPILMTEAALPTPWGFNGDKVLFEARKADYLVWVFVRNLYRGISGTTWYHIDDYGWRDSGLLDSKNRPLPAYRAYKVMTETLTGAGFPERLDGLGTGILGYQFEKGSHTIWVLFSEDGISKSINKTAFETKFGSIGHIYNLLGGPVTQTSTTITFDRPIYIDNIGNYAPYFSSTPLEEIDQDQNYFYYIETASTGDENFDIHTITLTSPLPGWLTFTDNGDGTATLTGTPRNGDVGSYTIELLVTDSVGNTATQSFTVTVHNVNDAPYFTSTPVKTAAENTPYTYNITATDPDLIHGDELLITGTTIPDWLSLVDHGNGTATLSGTPTTSDIGVHSVQLLVTDLDGLTSTQSFTITVANVNDPPSFTSTAVTTATQDQVYTYYIEVTDPDLAFGDILTITATTKPGWLTLTKTGSTTATLSGTPTNAQVGDHSVILKVTDKGGLSATQSFTITVANVNDQPSFLSAPVTGVNPDSPYTYNIVTTDPDLIHGDSLTITATTLPPWLTLNDNGNGTATLTGTPTTLQIGDHPVVLVVTDLYGSFDTQSFTISVSYVNKAPYFTSTPIENATENVKYTYNITATDPDLIYGDSITIIATTKPGWLTFSDKGDGTATLTGTPTNAQVGSHSVVLKVTDSEGLFATQSFTINVNYVNVGPTFTSTAPTEATQGIKYTYNIIAYDPNLLHGDTLTITATSTLPGWLTLTDKGDGTATLSGTPGDAEDIGDHTIFLKVMDSHGLFDTQTFTITVVETGTFYHYLPLVVQ